MKADSGYLCYGGVWVCVGAVRGNIDGIVKFRKSLEEILQDCKSLEKLTLWGLWLGPELRK